MMWKFINFQLRRWREHAQAQTLKKKQVPSKSKSKKDKGEQQAGGMFFVYVRKALINRINSQIHETTMFYNHKIYNIKCMVLTHT